MKASSQVKDGGRPTPASGSGASGPPAAQLDRLSAFLPFIFDKAPFS
jgi:hypothetical protein